MAKIRLHLCGDVDECAEGIRLLEGDYPFILDAGGLPVAVSQKPGASIHVTLREGQARLQYGEKVHFFRALGLLLEALAAGRDEVDIAEEPQFRTNGVMIDVSQGNAVLQVDTVKHILRRMAVMGLNMMMLYTDDSYVVPEEPYFGYMRSKYTHDELRECDRYAALFGIEMIPCIQTLAHLTDALRWPVYHHLREDEATLLVGEEKVYEFIERLIKAASAPFATKRIHIGMDEAWHLGLGAYLQRHGLRSKFDIMNEHLERVMAIVERLGLQPMIWSDMYFRAASRRGDYYDMEARIPPEIAAKIPKQLQLVYWDYYHYETDVYRDFIRRHRALGSDPIFAGGIWNWLSFGVNWGKTFRTTNPALTACKEEGIQEVFATLWGDNGTECNVYSILLGLQLFAEHGYARVVDEERLKRRFQFCTGACYDDVLQFKYLDEIPGVSEDNLETCNASKFLMWQDPLTGLFDANIAGLPLAAHYERLAAHLRQAEQRNGAYNRVFGYLAAASEVLALKAEIGLAITRAYRADDRHELQRIAGSVLPDLISRVEKLHGIHRDLWLATYKALGWEVIDMRYGALLARLRTAGQRLADFLAGRCACLEELDEPRRSYNGRTGVSRYVNHYADMVSASRIAARG